MFSATISQGRAVIEHFPFSDKRDLHKKSLSLMRVGVSGGLELAFNGEREFEIPFSAEQFLVKDVITEMADRIKANGGDVDIFLQDGLVRPGILVLINDADWELLDREDSVVTNSDNIHFSSTLHGG